VVGKDNVYAVIHLWLELDLLSVEDTELSYHCI
jgi:hypothetical protein